LLLRNVQRRFSCWSQYILTWPGIARIYPVPVVWFFLFPISDTRTLYTAVTATTPQIPLWAAIHAGWPGKGTTLRVEYWKTLDDLRGIMLAGRGDIWVGHLEGFAQAALRGAPVTLVAVTGWKKFYFVGPKTSPATDMETFAAELRQADQTLAVAPQDSPALAVLENMKERGGPSFAVAAMQPQQLLLEMLRGSRRYALLPEPLVSTLLAKRPEFHVAAGLEEEFSRRYGGPARLPLVGIAVNMRFAESEPETVRNLPALMEEHAARLAAAPEDAIAVLPESVRKSVGEDVLRASFSRDLILAVPAMRAKEEIATFLRMVLSTTDPAGLDALLDGPFLFRR
jgi:NitT/TauT family transport system substrate-binding protein